MRLIEIHPFSWTILSNCNMIWDDRKKPVQYWYRLRIVGTNLRQYSFSDSNAYNLKARLLIIIDNIFQEKMRGQIWL